MDKPGSLTKSHTLGSAVWERLDALTELANRADAPALLAVTRAEPLRFTESRRMLLTAHRSDAQGNRIERSTIRHQRKAPRSGWRIAYEHLVRDALAPGPARHLRPAASVP